MLLLCWKKACSNIFCLFVSFLSNWICPQFVHKGKGNLRPGLGVVYAPPNFSSTANGRGKRVKFDDARTHRSKVPVVILASLVIALLGQQFWSWKEKNNFFAKPCCVSAQFKSMCLALSAIAPAVNERQILGEKKTPFSAPIGQVSKVFRSGRFFYFLSQVNWWVPPPPLKLSSLDGNSEYFLPNLLTLSTEGVKSRSKTENCVVSFVCHHFTQEDLT